MATNRFSLHVFLAAFGLVTVAGTQLRAASPAEVGRWQAQQATMYAAKQETAAREAMAAERRREAAMSELRAAYTASAPRSAMLPRSAPGMIHTASHPGHYRPSSIGYAPSPTVGRSAMLMPVQAYQPRPADLPPALTVPHATPNYGYPVPTWQGAAQRGSCAVAVPAGTTQYVPVAYSVPAAVPGGGYPAAPGPFPMPYPPAVAPQPHSPYYVSENLFGQPKLFVDGQPVRNVLRSILP